MLPLGAILVLAGYTRQTNLPEDTIMSEQSAGIPAIRQSAEDSSEIARLVINSQQGAVHRTI